jgi:hypothetical protein
VPAQGPVPQVLLSPTLQAPSIRMSCPHGSDKQAAWEKEGLKPQGPLYVPSPPKRTEGALTSLLECSHLHSPHTCGGCGVREGREENEHSFPKTLTLTEAAKASLPTPLQLLEIPVRN